MIIQELLIDLSIFSNMRFSVSLKQFNNTLELLSMAVKQINFRPGQADPPVGSKG